MADGIFALPNPTNEPVLEYRPGSPERRELRQALLRMASECVEIPLVIGGRRVHTGKVVSCVMPHDHGHVLGT